MQVVGSLWLNDKKLTTTWSEFETAFYRWFICIAVKSMRRAMFFSLDQDDISMVDFEQKFTI